MNPPKVLGPAEVIANRAAIEEAEACNIATAIAESIGTAYQGETVFQISDPRGWSTISKTTQAKILEHFAAVGWSIEVIPPRDQRDGYTFRVTAHEAKLPGE